MKIKDFFTPDVQGILTEDTLSAIEQAFAQKIEEAKTAALEEQDSNYAQQLQQLVEAIDKDHSAKMISVLEQHDKDKTAKLVKLTKMFTRKENGELRAFKKQIVESVGCFIDEFINETISKEDLSQAVKNRTAYSTLEKLRKVLSIDSVMMKESVAGALIEGKTRMDNLASENEELKKTVKALSQQIDEQKKVVFLKDKTSKFSEPKRIFIEKAFEGKSSKFVKENFEHTVRLFERTDTKTSKALGKSVLESRDHIPDFVTIKKVVNEKVNKDEAHNPYVSELEKVRK